MLALPDPPATPPDWAAAIRTAAGGRYTNFEPLGEGGMAQVFSAWDEKQGRAVAIKVLKPAALAGSGPERFLREIKLTAGLQHPGILPLLDSGALSVGGGLLPFLVTPLVNGSTLRLRLDLEGRLHWDEVLEIVADVAGALAFAHRRGVIHRDVKPENLLLTESGSVLVADFGVARADWSDDPDLTAEGVRVGTPLYMSAEQALGEPVDARADQYSLAAVVYEMVSGQPLHLATTAAGVLARRLTEGVPQLAGTPGIPVGLDRVLAKALARRPEDRFPSIEEFAAALSGLSAAPASVDGVSRGPRRRRWVAAGLSVIALAALAVAHSRATREEAGPPTIVVLPFRNLTLERGGGAAGAAVAEAVATEIRAAGLGSPASRAVEADGRASSGGGRVLAQSVGAAFAISGVIQRVADSLEVSADVIDVRSGAVRAALPPRRSGAVDAAGLVAAIREPLLGALALAVDAPGRSPVLSRSGGAPAFAAYQRHVRALSLARRLEFDSAAVQALQAYAGDTSFVQPLLLAIEARFDGGQVAVADSLLRVIDRRNAGLSSIDRLLAEFLRARLAGDHPGAATAAAAIDRLAPSDENKIRLAQAEFGRNRVAAARAQLAAIDPERSVARLDGRFWRLIAMVWHADQRTGELPALAERGRRGGASDKATVELDLLAAASRGAEPLLDSLLLQLRRMESRTGPTAAELTVAAVAEIRVHGSPGSSGRLAQGGLDWLEVTGAIREPKLAPDVIALMIEAGRAEDALPLARAWAAGTDAGPLAAAMVAVLEANRDGGTKAGASLGAEPVSARLDAGPGEREYAKARVAAAGGDFDAAISWLGRAVGNGMPAASPVLHRDPVFDRIRQRPDFRALVEGRGSAPDREP